MKQNMTQVKQRGNQIPRDTFEGLITKNTVILAIIGTFSLIGVLAFLARLIFSLFTNILGFQIPFWFFPMLFISCLFIAFLFPSATGRTVTALLAKRVGFLSLKMDKLDIWNLKAEGVSFESPSLGHIYFESLKVYFKKFCFQIELGKVRIEFHVKSSSKPSTKKRKPPISAIALLRYVRYVQVNVDFVELSGRGTTFRIRDLTMVFRMGKMTSRTASLYQALLVKASLGTFNMRVDEDVVSRTSNMDEDNSKSVLLPTRSGRLTAEADELFSFEEDDEKATTSVKPVVVSSRVPPFLDITHANFSFHASPSVDLSSSEKEALPIEKGCKISFGSIKLSASASTLMTLKKLFNQPADIESSQPQRHPLTLMIDQLTNLKADPFEFSIASSSCSWLDAKGTCLMTNIGKMDLQVTATSGLTCIVQSPSLLVGVGEPPILALDSLQFELHSQAQEKMVGACLAHGIRISLNPVEMFGLERAHIEFLRFVRSSLLYHTAPLRQSQVPSPAHPPISFIHELEIATTNRIVIKFYSTTTTTTSEGVEVEQKKEVLLQVETISGHWSMLKNKGYLNVDDFELLCGGDSILKIESLDSEREDQNVQVEIKKIFLFAGAAPALRAHGIWKRFAPRVSHWRESASALQAVTEAETRDYRRKRAASLNLNSKSTLNLNLIMKSIELNLMLGERKGVQVCIVFLQFSGTTHEGKATDIVLFGFGKGNKHAIVQITEVLATLTPLSSKLTINDVRLNVSSKHQPFPGELLRDYFAQRKAFQIALKETQEVGSHTINQGNSSILSKNSSSEVHELDPDADVEKFHLDLSVTNISIALEDDEAPDEKKFAAQGFFPIQRSMVATGGVKNILLVTCTSIDASMSVITAWKSKAGPSSDASLLKRTPPRSQRTRAYLLKILTKADLSSCPTSRLERALVHGMGDLIGFEIKSCVVAAVKFCLSDYPLPLFSFDALNFQNGSKILLADLRAVPCSTRSVQVVLAEARVHENKDENNEIVVSSTSSFIPMKVYFEISGSASNVNFTWGTCFNPALVALDRALMRTLPSSSDSTSPKLGWWDRTRYLLHGKTNMLITSGLEIRYLTTDPRCIEDSIIIRSSDAAITDSVEEEDDAPPVLGNDLRVWEITFSDYTLSFSRKDFEEAWRCYSGGDHYVQLQHVDAETPEQVADQYAQFRSSSLSLGLDFEVKRTFGNDFSPKDKCPIIEMCWRPIYPIICASLRGIAPPVPRVENANQTLDKLLSHIAFNVRADRPHILWWEDRSHNIGFISRGKTVDSRATFIKQDSKWAHESVLSQFAAVEAFILFRSSTTTKQGVPPPVTTAGGGGGGLEEFIPGDYAFGIGFPHEPFFVAPAMRLTLGKWSNLVSDKEFITGGDDTNTAYRLCIDDARLVWTLTVRDETFRFFGTLAYIIRKEGRVQAEIARQLSSSQTSEITFNKNRIRRMDLSWLWNRPRQVQPAGVNTEPSILDKFPFLNSRMGNFLMSRKGSDAPQVHEDKYSDSKSEARDRPPSCSNSNVSADGLKSTWEESSREYTVELRWPQVSLLHDRSVVVLTSKSAIITDFRLGLFDLDSKSSLLLRKEMDVEVIDAQMFAAVSDSETRWVKSQRPPGAKFCLDSSEFDTSFCTARGSVRRGTTIHAFTEKVLNLSPSSPNLLPQAIIESRVKRNGALFLDICSDDQDPSLEKVGWTDGFQVTDIVYTDTTGGAKVPSSHLGMKLSKSDACLKSKEFFVVLVIVRDLLLVGPPPDVKELAILAEQEALEELKRRWKSSHPTDVFEKVTTEEEISTVPAWVGDTDSKQLKAYIELVCKKRRNSKRWTTSSQRIVYELGECNLTLVDQIEKKVRVQVFNLRGDHSFSLDGSTKVEFEVGDLKVFDLTSTNNNNNNNGQQIVECQLLDKNSKVPFLRADAITSAPIIVHGCRITVYELLQVHLYPGNWYRIKVKLSQSIALFVKNFLVGDDDVLLPETFTVNEELNDEDVNLITTKPVASLPVLLTSPMVATLPPNAGAAANALASGSGSGITTSNSQEFSQIKEKNKRFSLSFKGIFSSRDPNTGKQSRNFEARGNNDSSVLETTMNPSSITVPPVASNATTDESVVPGNFIMIRTGVIHRLSVPKQHQVSPEPTVLSWTSTHHRRNVLILIVKKNRAFLEFHKNEMGLRLKVTPRAVIPLSSIYSIRRSLDPTAPSHAIDLFYTLQPTSTTPGGEAVFTFAAEEPGWTGKDQALPWVAAIAPGLEENVIEGELKLEIQQASLESIVKRSRSVMKFRHLTPIQTVGTRNEEDTDSVISEDEKATPNSTTPKHATTPTMTVVSPLDPSPTLNLLSSTPPTATNPSTTTTFPLQTQVSAEEATNTLMTSNKHKYVDEHHKQKYVEIAFFKYARIGQIQLELTLIGFSFQGFTVVNTLQRNAFAAAKVYHRRILTWSKAFKMVQRDETITLFTSYVRGGTGGNNNFLLEEEEEGTVSQQNLNNSETAAMDESSSLPSVTSTPHHSTQSFLGFKKRGSGNDEKKMTMTVSSTSSTAAAAANTTTAIIQGKPSGEEGGGEEEGKELKEISKF